MRTKWRLFPSSCSIACQEVSLLSYAPKLLLSILFLLAIPLFSVLPIIQLPICPLAVLPYSSGGRCGAQRWEKWELGRERRVCEKGRLVVLSDRAFSWSWKGEGWWSRAPSWQESCSIWAPRVVQLITEGQNSPAGWDKMADPAVMLMSSNTSLR